MTNEVNATEVQVVAAAPVSAEDRAKAVAALEATYAKNAEVVTAPKAE